MQINTSIRVKAIFLLFVFFLNTLVGFACSMGVNMGFNASHHHEDEAQPAEKHFHLHNTLHDHHSKTATRHSHINKEEGNCCNDEVIKFSQVDKSTTQAINAGISPIFFTAFISSFYAIDLLHTFQTTVNGKYFLRSYHPPIPDICIAIQRFLI